VCNFATPNQLIGGDGISSPVSGGVQLRFAGIFSVIASGESLATVADTCWSSTVLRVKTASWEGGVADVVNESYTLW
jgi:hypothetical protein